MVKYNINDIVIVRLKDNEIQDVGSEYNRYLQLKIIGMRNDYYVAYVSEYDKVNNVFELTNFELAKFGIHPTYRAELACLVYETAIVDRASDGMNCARCLEYFPYAEANQENGTLICYQCRANPWR